MNNKPKNSTTIRENHSIYSFTIKSRILHPNNTPFYNALISAEKGGFDHTGKVYGMKEEKHLTSTKVIRNARPVETVNLVVDNNDFKFSSEYNKLYIMSRKANNII